MAVAAVEFLLENLKELLIYHIGQLTQGEDVVRWIDYELETLIPQLERIEASTEVSKETEDLAGRIRDVIRRGEDLSATHKIMEIYRDAATVKTLYYNVKIWKASAKLHSIKGEISDLRDLLLKQHLQTVSHSAAEEQQLPSAEPFYLRRCMRYFLLFPPNHEVRARRLIVLWVAEGLVHSRKHDDQSAEQIARGYLNELTSLGMIQVQEKRSGKLTYSIDATRRAAVMKEAEKAEFLQVKDGKIRRLVDHVDDNDSTTAAKSFIQIQGNAVTFKSTRSYREVISFLSFNTQEGIKPGEDVGDFLRKCISKGCFIWLRVLDLEGVFRPKLPDTLGKLTAIKYLGLRWTYLEKLPDSVDKLFSLQVLDVKHTYISVLPRSLWRMQHLRHLYLSEAYRTRFPDPPSKVTLTALQTLWGAFVDEDTPVKGGLDRLFNIRKLGLSCRSNASKPGKMAEQLEAIDKWISNLEFLDSLRLKSRDENNKAVDLRLTSLKRNRKLSTLYLLGKLGGLVLCKLPASLTNVTLSGSGLDLDPLEFLGRLPNLVTLRLLGQSVGCSKMYCSKRSFGKLKVLWIWKLEDLEDLEAEEGSLPCLDELWIRDCPKLKSLPHQLRCVPDLEIKLTPQRTVLEARSKNAEV